MSLASSESNRENGSFDFVRRAVSWGRSLFDRTPLRVQLVCVVLILVTVALVLAGVAGTAALRGYLLERVDDRLHDTARGAMASGRLPGALDGDRGGPLREERNFNGPALAEGFFTEVADEYGNGTGYLRVPAGSQQTAPQLPSLSLDNVAKRDGKPFTVDAKDRGDRWRILVTALPDNAGSLVVGTSLTDVSNTLTRLVIIQLCIGIIVLLLLGITGYAAVRSSLRKLVRVEQTAAAIAGGDLTQRIDAGDERTEVGRLGTALNSMLGRIESSFAAQQASEAQARESETRMRRFVGDASHELRTPLTSIRGFAELQRQAVNMDAEERNRLTARIEAEATRMGLLVEDLLLLARLDQQRPLERDAVDIVDLVDDVLADAPVLGGDHPISLKSVPSEEEIWVLGDRARLRQILTNLVSNAYVHTPPGTRIEVSVVPSQDAVSLVVADEGPGLSDEEAQRVFERFFRSDPSRTRASGGSGLGLSIVSSLVEAHDGTISLATSPGNGAAFTVTLPRIRIED